MTTSKMFSFLPLVNSLVTITVRFLLLSIPAVTSSNAINTLRSLLDCVVLCFYEYHPYHSSIQ